MSKHTHHAIIPLTAEEAGDKGLCIMVEGGGWVPYTAEFMNSRAGLGVADPNETMVHVGDAPEMAEEIERLKALCAERLDLGNRACTVGENAVANCNLALEQLSKAEAQRDALAEAVVEIERRALLHTGPLAFRIAEMARTAIEAAKGATA